MAGQAETHQQKVQARWKACVDDIRRDKVVYGGLALTPQFGRVPLERNARTGLWEFVHLATGSAPKPNDSWKSTEAKQTESKHPLGQDCLSPETTAHSVESRCLSNGNGS